MRYKLIVAGYNCFDYAQRCLDSIASQTLKNYDVCVVDDASTDERLAPMLEAYCATKGWLFLHREENAGALRSQYEGIQLLAPEDGDVIVWVDLDDALSSERSLEILDSYYDDDTLMTYGTYQSVPYSETCPPVLRYPEECEQRNEYRNMRKWGLLYNHLRTVKWDIFKRLNVETDFMYQGEWMALAADTAVMIPCLEMASGRYKVIPEVLYNYSSDNPISEWRKAPAGTDDMHAHLMNAKKKRPV
jgi:glycosyltransferase involved in cell wall biosynthesis